MDRSIRKISDEEFICQSAQEARSIADMPEDFTGARAAWWIREFNKAQAARESA